MPPAKILSFADAAEVVLKASKTPLHSKQIAAVAIEQGLIETKGKTPDASMAAVLSVRIKSKGPKARFVRVRRGVYGLRGVHAEADKQQGPGPAGQPAEASAPSQRVKVPLFPPYEGVRAVLPIWDGHPRAAVTGIRSSLKPHRGNPKSNADWSDPDDWIGRFLQGAEASVASKVWSGTKKLVNPSDLRGPWLLASNYGLIAPDDDGILRLTPFGQDFIDNPSGEAVRHVDAREGLLKILALVAELGPGQRGAFLDEWREYLARNSRIRGEGAVRSYLHYRMSNLAKRGLLVRSGMTWSITEAGLSHLKDEAVVGEADDDEDESAEQNAELWQLLASQKERVRDQVHELLFAMDPYAFEGLVKTLLEAMGYDDVEVTKASNDKGVDVVGSIEVGITAVKEVVQVKRHKANVRRTVLDALRGSLHRWQAVRGTVITTAGFSKGARDAAFEAGAAPITLIDGNTLVDLLLRHEIGVIKKPVEVWELDASPFTDGGGDDEGDGE